MNVDRNILIRISIIAVLYAIVIPLAQLTVPNNIEVIITLIITVPVICGVLFGTQAFIGILIGGAIASIEIHMGLVSGMIFALVSASSSLCAYKCFQSLKRSGGNEYIHNSRSLISFVVSSSLTSSIFYSILILLMIEYKIPLGDNYILARYDVLWTVLIVGTSIMLLLSIKFCKPITSHPVHEENWRYLFYIPLIISLILWIIYDMIHPENFIMITFCTLSMLLFGIFGPSKRIVFNRDEFISMKFQIFSFLLIISLILSILLISSAYYIISSYEMSEQMCTVLYAYRTFIAMAVFVMFSFGSSYVEKMVTKPIYDLTNNVRNDSDTNTNELRVLSDRLDFVSKNKESIKGNDFILLIGLTKRDSSLQFKPAYAKKIIDKICLRYVNGYISSTEMTGGYKGQECTVTENVMSYRILGASDEMIQNILEDIVKELEQESVLVIKNGTSKWYYYGNKNI